MVVLLGVLSVSMASVLFRFATAEPLVVAFYRLAFSVLILAAPVLWRRGARDRPGLRDAGLAMVSGLFLAAHFAAWFFSLKMTSIASSTVLVSTHPFVVLLYGYLFRGERTGKAALAGVLMAVAGAGLIGWGDFRLDAAALAGDALAFLGAITVSGYLLIGRDLRQRMSAITYSAIAYATAATALLLVALLLDNPLTGFAPVNWWIFAALAVFPTLLGHTLFNWALRYVPATVVSVNILGEPIGASLLAWLIWRTAPGPVSLAGGILLLIGIAIFIRYQRPT